MRVQYVLTHLAYGGAETQVVELCRHMQRRGWEVGVVSLMTPSALTDRLAELGVELRTLGLARGQYSPRLVTGLVREVRRFRPDVLHSHTLPANFAARAARPFTPAKVLVTSAHNVWEGGRAKMLYYRLTDRVADLTTNCSVAAVERYVRIGAAPADRIRFMPNGIDTARFAPDPAIRARVRAELGLGSSFTWLAVGRMTVQKDWPNMLDACLTGLGEGDRLLIVGNGELEEEVRQAVRQRGLESRVTHLGSRSDIPDLMRAADGYLMSSAWEGLPIVLLEASASALPIVATDVGGNAEIVTSGETGWLVPARAPAALATAMRRARDLPEENRLRIGALARSRVEARYGMEAVAGTWEAIYLELLRRRSTA